MDVIIEKLPKYLGYKMRNTSFNVLCYTDDVVLLAETEDDLQRSLYQFNMTAKQYNMNINKQKPKCMVIAKEPVRCKPY